MTMAASGLLPTVISSRPRLFIALILGVVTAAVLPATLPAYTRAVIGWDVMVSAFLVMSIHLFSVQRPEHMQADAAAQEEGEWTIFWITLAAVTASFVVIVFEFSASKDAGSSVRTLRIALVAFTLFASWLMTHFVFAMRYAHEFYQVSPDQTGIDMGLEFPGEDTPDYWDFAYFSLILGMTFQVSDVQITSRKLRRLAMIQGVMGFLFNTVIIALTVNIAASLL
jgi:uncharacterized membrane protein